MTAALHQPHFYSVLSDLVSEPGAAAILRDSFVNSSSHSENGKNDAAHFTRRKVGKLNHPTKR
jgi:hypothetical protein